jgi:hypothetical protein
MFVYFIGVEQSILLQNFWDPATQTEFHYNKISSTWNPSWWFGEPVR